MSINLKSKYFNSKVLKLQEPVLGQIKIIFI